MFRLTAGCSINPTDLGELLIAADIYQRGLAAALMADLMIFDKTVQRQGPEFIHQAIAQAEAKGEALSWTFQVIDETTQQAATHPRNCQMVLIDLTTQGIRCSQDIEILPAGEVRIQIGGADTDRLVRYMLPPEWKIENF